MDSIDQYILNSKRGGASGEITIRDALVRYLRSHLNVEVDVASSDEHFEQLAASIKKGRYAFAVLDAWTWAARGWVPKRPLIGFEDKVFLLDFFGAKGPTRNGIKVPPSRILTAFPTYPGNTFLGYAIAASQLPSPPFSASTSTAKTKTTTKKKQGVIWGKDPKHYEGRWGLLQAIADMGVILHSTLPASRAVGTKHKNILYHGHLSKIEWHELLSSSMFMLVPISFRE